MPLLTPFLPLTALKKLFPPLALLTSACLFKTIHPQRLQEAFPTFSVPTHPAAPPPHIIHSLTLIRRLNCTWFLHCSFAT